MKNTSGLEPRGCAVLIQTYEPELDTTRLQIPDQVRYSQQMMNQRAIVVAIGPSAWQDERQPRAAIGEHVLVTKYAGFMAGADVTADGKVYRLVNDRDIFCAVRKE